MIYEYVCEKCGNVQDENCSMDSFKEFRPICSKCGGECAYQFNPNGVQFILKDGPTGSWPSKGQRIKGQMDKRSKAAAKRQRDRYGIKKAIPNYNGVETESWREAQYQALRDKGTESAATYNAKVKEESKKI